MSQPSFLLVNVAKGLILHLFLQFHTWFWDYIHRGVIDKQSLLFCCLSSIGLAYNINTSHLGWPRSYQNVWAAYMWENNPLSRAMPITDYQRSRTIAPTSLGQSCVHIRKSAISSLPRKRGTTTGAADMAPWLMSDLISVSPQRVNHTGYGFGGSEATATGYTN